MTCNIKDIMGFIKEGIPVLTVNTRLSRYLHSRFDMEMEMNGGSAWPTPVIIPLFSWIENLWNESWPDRPVLSATRAQVLWDKIVSRDNLLPRDIIMSRGVAKTSYDAYAMIWEYGISLPDELYLTEEAKALKRWAEAYENEVDRLGFVEKVYLPGMVAQFMRNKKIAVPKRVILAGLDEISHQTALLISTIEGNGGRVEFWPQHPDAYSKFSNYCDLSVREYADEVEEVVQASRWARKTLRPGERVGIVVPDLERYKNIIIREFTSELDPKAVFPWTNAGDVFNISLGAPLSDEPLVKAALEIISIGNGPVDINIMSAILLSPYFSGSGDEHLYLARLDAAVKREGRFIVTLSEVLKAIDRTTSTLSYNGPGKGVCKYNPTGCRGRIHNWLKALAECRKPDLPSRWSVKLSNLLKCIEFPFTSLTLNSGEYQALKGWNSLLEGLASLDDILGEINRPEAVSILKKMAADTIFQPESPECPIQVMGLLESSGIFFDRIWLLGVHSDIFPAQPSPNSFIPISTQKGNNLPHSTAERELEYSRRLLNKLLNSANSFEASFPKTVDKKEVFVSPLFDSLENSTLKKGGEGGFISESSRVSDSVHSIMIAEEMPDDADIPPNDAELRTITGGTSIIKDQSWCPFRAFAIHRLYASGIDAPGIGISVQDRGSIVHAALKFLWERIGGSTELKKIIANNELDRYIKESASEAFKKYYSIQPLSEKYLGLEKERVFELLRKWVEDVESKRNGFTVEKTEYQTDIAIGGLTIKARLDRIDSTNDGKKIIIDYKTGNCSKNDWLTERPKEPQLLIYNLVDSFDAISFAKVKPGECGFIGISKEDDMVPKVVRLEKDVKLREKLQGINTWDELADSWKCVVNGLVRQFLEGRNEVDPIDKACDNCELKGLCRRFDGEPDR